MKKELDTVGKMKGIRTNKLFGVSAIPSTVLAGLSQHPWVHISCHGWVNRERPQDSFFQLEQEEKLTVHNIINARLPDAELAFLSACHSAAGGSSLPDETLHLASALQFAGFKSVVGTMWEMFDGDGPVLAKAFYKRLMQLGGDHKESAAALHYAIKKLMRTGLSPGRWAMFVHIGA